MKNAWAQWYGARQNERKRTNEMNTVEKEEREKNETIHNQIEISWIYKEIRVWYFELRMSFNSFPHATVTRLELYRHSHIRRKYIFSSVNYAFI